MNTRPYTILKAALHPLAAIVLVFAPSLAPAAQEGDFIYTDNGSTITIDGYVSGAPAAVVIPETIIGKPVTAIKSQAFGLRSDLSSVTIPDSVTSIGQSAFLYCSGLTHVTLPSNLTSLGVSALSGCSGLTSVTVPAGITSLENGMFSNCSSLQSVTFAGNLTSIGASAFHGCSGLQYFVIPPTVTTIGSRAFQNCSNLTSVTLPPNLSTIAEYTFAGCSNLQSIAISASVTSIGFQAFINCYQLSSLTLPGGLASIGNQSFYNCDGLTSITIPASVTTIDYRAFYQSSNLAEAIFLGNAPATVGAEIFHFTAEGFTIYHSPEATGFDVSPWTDYALGTTGSDPLADWLVENELPADADLLSDDNGDGVNLLMAYALNLNPNLNQSTSLPQPIFSTDEMSMSFLEAADDITYVVETSEDMTNWTPEGVTLSELDVNNVRTATVPMSGSTRFMRLSVSR